MKADPNYTRVKKALSHFGILIEHVSGSFNRKFGLRNDFYKVKQEDQEDYDVIYGLGDAVIFGIIGRSIRLEYEERRVSRRKANPEHLTRRSDYLKRKRKNPASTRALALNPHSSGDLPDGKLIYGRIIAIEAQKTQPHKCDDDCKAHDHCYRHDFELDDVKVLGLSDGRILIQ